MAKCDRCDLNRRAREDWKLGHRVGIRGLGGEWWFGDLCIILSPCSFCGRMRIADGGGDTILYLFVCGFAREHLVQARYPWPLFSCALLLSFLLQGIVWTIFISLTTIL